MMKPVEERAIFHITHIDNLPAILADGCLWSDYEVQKTPNRRTVIGFETIKKRRLEALPVSCHPSTFVGQYVPFYFCPRSPMLYVIHRRNSELSYQGGQERIVHLVSRINIAIQHSEGRPWAFTDGNAGARYTRFSNDLAQFDDFVDWNAVQATYWSDPTVKERKQVEFLIHQKLPWSGIGGIGVYDQRVAAEVQRLLAALAHRPSVAVKRGWYY
jgi:hypothetical protein